VCLQEFLLGTHSVLHHDGTNTGRVVVEPLVGSKGITEDPPLLYFGLEFVDAILVSEVVSHRWRHGLSSLRDEVLVRSVRVPHNGEAGGWTIAGRHDVLGGV
jgi:hypothetical protein